jgi:hypothetical protein
MAIDSNTASALIPSTLFPRDIPARRRVVTPLPAVTQAHHELIEVLAVDAPSPIIGYAADRFDILERAGHLKAVLDAVAKYAKVIVKDTAHFSPINILDETAGLADSTLEIVGALLNANDRLQDLEAAADE